METRLISELKTNPLNPRGEVLDDEALHELAASIRSHGVLQPILVTPDGTIVAGHRRARACEIAHVIDIPIVVRDLDESEQIQIMLIENLQRQSLTALQTAKAYQMLCDKGLSVRQISMAIGYHTESISRHLSILKLPEELHSCFDGADGLPLGGISYLLKLDEFRRVEVALKAKERGWTIARLRRAVEGNNPRLPKDSEGYAERIFEKMEDGCYTPEAVAACGECGRWAFSGITIDDIRMQMEKFVAEGKAERRKQGGKTEVARGEATTLYVPAGTPSAETFTTMRPRSIYDRALDDDMDDDVDEDADAA